MEKNNFILYKDWKPLIDNLTDEQSGKLFKGIYQYVCGNGDELPTNLDNTTSYVFEFIKSMLHKDLVKYRNKCKQNSESAKQRYESMRTHTNASERIQDNANAYERIRTDAKVTDNDNDNDNDIDNDIYKKKNIIKKKKFGEYGNVTLSEKEYNKYESRHKKDNTPKKDIEVKYDTSVNAPVSDDELESLRKFRNG